MSCPMCSVTTKSFVRIFLDLNQVDETISLSSDDADDDEEEEEEEQKTKQGCEQLADSDVIEICDDDSPSRKRTRGARKKTSETKGSSTLQQYKRTAKALKNRLKEVETNKSELVKKHDALTAEHMYLMERMDHLQEKSDLAEEASHNATMLLKGNKLELARLRSALQSKQRFVDIASDEARKAKADLGALEAKFKQCVEDAQVGSISEAKEMLEHNRALVQENQELKTRLQELNDARSGPQIEPSSNRKEESRSSIKVQRRRVATFVDAKRAEMKQQERKAASAAARDLSRSRMQGKMSNQAIRIARAMHRKDRKRLNPALGLSTAKMQKRGPERLLPLATPKSRGSNNTDIRTFL